MGRSGRVRRFATEEPGLQTPRAAVGRAFIIVGGRPVATKSTDVARVHETQSISGEGLSSMELLSSVVTSDLTCVVVVQRGKQGVAFAVSQGRVVAAFGSGPRGSMRAWSKAARTQELRRCREDDAGPAVGMAKMFIERCVLEHLGIIDEVGARLTILRGDATWVGPKLDPEQAPPLQFLLMELAREADECSRYQPKLEPLSRYAFRSSSPSEDERVLHQVWKQCNGRTTLQSLVEQSVYGRAATLRALTSLRRQGFIELRGA